MGWMLRRFPSCGTHDLLSASILPTSSSLLPSNMSPCCLALFPLYGHNCPFHLTGDVPLDYRTVLEGVPPNGIVFRPFFPPPPDKDVYDQLG